MVINDWSSSTLIWFVVQNIWLYTLEQDWISKPGGHSTQNTCPRRYLQGSSSFQSRTLSSHFSFGHDRSSKYIQREIVRLFYWKSFGNRWVLSNTLMKTICSQYFASRQHHMVDFHLIAGKGPMNSSHGEIWACTSRRAVSHDFRPLSFRGTSRMEQIRFPATWFFW